MTEQTRANPASDGAGMGAPGDAFAQFLQVATGAATELAVERTGDRRVSAAFSLGWQMAELYRPVNLPPLIGAVNPDGGTPVAVPAGVTPEVGSVVAAATGAQPEVDSPGPIAYGSTDPSTPDGAAVGPVPSLPRSKGDLPGISKMTPDERDRGARKQIDAALAQLATTVTAAGLTMPDEAMIAPCVTGDNFGREVALRALHVELLSTLIATDIRLGKAYNLGRALSDTSRSPRDVVALRKRFKASKVAKLRTELDDLATAFPPHAANAVNKSLCLWSKALELRATTPSDQTDEDLLTYAGRQGQMWRGLLSGDKRGEDMLRPSDYLQAVGRSAAEIRGLTWQLTKEFPYLAALAVILFVGGIALMIFVSGSGSIAAGAVTILTSLGLTWKSIGGAAGRVEHHLWGAEVDTAIAEATFMLGQDSQTSEERRRLARQTAQGQREAAQEQMQAGMP